MYKNTPDTENHHLDAFDLIFSHLISGRTRMRRRKGPEPVNPELDLIIWNCSNCGCDCAGESTSKLCYSCESLTALQRGENQ